MRQPDPLTKWVWLPRERWPQFQESPVSVFAADAASFTPRVCRFLRRFVSDDDSLPASLVISADSRYRVYLNGGFVGEGPARPGGDYDNAQAPDWWFYEEYDVTGQLVRGTNLLCVDVVLGPTRQQDYSMGQGGLYADLAMGSAEPAHIVTDERWLCAPSPAHVGMLSLDARLEADPGWPCHATGEQWSAAEVLADQRPGLLHASGTHPLHRSLLRPLALVNPFPGQRHRVRQEADGLAALTFAPGGPCTFWLDFGKVHAAQILADIEAPRGTSIEFECQEVIGRTDKNGKPETVVLADGPLRYRSPELRSGRYVKVTVGAAESEARLSGIALESFSYHSEERGAFRCSDPELNEIYEACTWTERLCAQTIHLDSPVHQEGLGCTGDYVIESLIDYRAFGDATLARADIKRTAALLQQKHGLMFHPSYSLLWIEWVLDYWMHTGDLALVEDSMDCVGLLVERFEGYLGPTGLIEGAPSYMFLDWVENGVHNLHHPPRFMGQAALTAFFVGALRNAAQLYEAGGRGEDASRVQRLADRTAEAFRTQLWRPDRGLYCDGLLGADALPAPSRWLPADPGKQESYSAHTNVLAVRYGICQPALAQEVLERAIGDPGLPRMQPYFLHFAFAALDTCGLYNERALGMLRQWTALLAENPGSLKEVWSGFDCDYSHAWSGTPAYQASAGILGVIPAEPGFDRVVIAPALGDLAWAEGIVPTRHGPIEVSLQCDDGQISGTVTLPHGVEAAVSLERSKPTVRGHAIRFIHGYSAQEPPLPQAVGR